MRQRGGSLRSSALARAVVVAGLAASTLIGAFSGSAEHGPAVARAEQPIIVEPPAMPTLQSGPSGAPLAPLQQGPQSPQDPPFGPPSQPAGAGSPVPAESYFAETGYYVGSGAIWEFFRAHGGGQTFGPPLSNVFTLSGRSVQIFRNHVLEVRPDGRVGPLALLDSGAIPSTRLGGRTVPARDASLAASAPATSTSSGSAAAHAFAQANAPDVWNGLPVNFLQRYLAASGPPPATPDTALQVWGLPVSKVARDPARPDLVHLRWERGVMEYNAATGRTQPVPLGELFKAILTGEGLPAELALDAQGSPYYRQYSAALPQGLLRPDLLPDSSLERAFEPNVVGGWTAAPSQGAPLLATATPSPSTAASTPTPSPTPTPTGDACTGAEEMSYVPDRPRVGTELLIVVTSARQYAYPRLAGTERTNFVRERSGQLGFVYEWTINLTYSGDHDYTFYVDSTIRCKRLTLEVRDALGTVELDNGNGDFSNGNGSADDNSNDNEATATPRIVVVTATPTPTPR